MRVGGSKTTGGLIGFDELTQIRRGKTVKGFEGEEANLKLNALLDIHVYI